MATVMRRWVPGLLLVAALVAACDEGLGPRTGPVNLVIQPRFAQQETGALEQNPALLVDNVRVLIVNEAGDTVVDEVVEWPLDQDTLELEIAIDVAGEETFELTLQGREGEAVLFQAGPLEVSLSSGTSEPTTVQPVLEYAGPEAGLASVTIGAPAVAFTAGAQVQLTASGVTGDDDTVDDPLVIWTSLDTLAATVDSTGLVRVGHDAARTVRIVARVAFRTLADTVEAAVVPASFVFTQSPDTIAAIGFRQEVNAVGLGVAGDTVRNLELDWQVRDAGIVQYTPDDIGTHAAVFAAAQGATWLVASVAGTGSADSVLVVVDQVVTGAAPMPSRAVLSLGDTVALSIVAVDAGGTPVADADPPAWLSSDPAIAMVDTLTGVVTAEGAPDPFTNGAAVTGEIEGSSYAARIEVLDGVNVGPPTAVSVGDLHSCRLESIGGRIYCRGAGESGQIGNGSTADQDYAVEAFNPAMSPGETHTQVTVGGVHTCALLDTIGGSEAFCWGDNRFGQVGDGSLTNRIQPTAVNNTAGADFTSLYGGGVHTCALTGAGAAYCWGYNLFGQLGDGNAPVPSPVPVAVAGGHTFTDLAAGWLHTCGLEADGTVWCWGRGAEGQLGDGTGTDTGAPVQVAGGVTFVDITAGAAHTCGLTATGAVHCWGYNSSGQIGTGTAGFTVGTPTQVTFPGGATITSVSLGWIHGCALAADGAVYCWGGNDQLQLGQANPRSARSPIAVPLNFSPTALAAGGGETCGLDVSRMVCWGGIPRDVLGRDVLVVPPSGMAGLDAGVLSGR